MNEQKLFVHQVNFPIRWGDMDAFGHVNNSVFFAYFEQARVSWWEKIAIYRLHADEGPVVITAECTFLKQLFYPANLAIKVYVGPPGRSSYMIYYEIFLEHDLHTLYAHGSTKVVWTNYKAGKSLALPEIMLQYLPKKPDAAEKL